MSKKADSTLRASRAVPHPSTDRALCRLTSEVRRDPVHSTRYGRQQQMLNTLWLEELGGQGWLALASMLAADTMRRPYWQGRAANIGRDSTGGDWGKRTAISNRLGYSALTRATRVQVRVRI